MKIITNKILRTFPVISIYGVGTALRYVTVFILTAFYTRYFTHRDYGLYSLYFSISLVVFMIGELQLNSAIFREYYNCKTEDEKRELLNTVWRYYITIQFFCIIILFLLCLFGYVEQFFYLLPMVLAISAYQMFDTIDSTLRLQFKHIKYLIVNFSEAILILLFSFLLVYCFNLGVKGALWSIFLPRIAIVLFLMKFSNFSFSFFGFNMRVFLRLLKYSLPILFSVMAGWLFTYIAKFIIVLELGLKNLAVYTVIFQVAYVFSFFVQILRAIWIPLLMYKISRSTDDIIQRFVSWSASLYAIVGALVFVLIGILSKYILMLMAGNSYWQYAGLIKYGLVMVYLQGLIIFVSVGNLWERKTEYNALSTLIGGAIFLVITFFSIKKIGILGPMIGIDVGMLLNMIAVWIFASHNRRIDYHWFIIVPTLVFVISLAFLFF